MSVVRWRAGIGLLLGLCLVATGQEEERRIVFPGNGFSIAPLEARAASAPCVPLAMSLPPSGGLAPNINVQIQSYPGSIQEYLSLSKGQFEKLDWTILRAEVIGKSVALFEYTGKVRSLHLHFYARAFKRGDRVFLVTAAAVSEQWPAVGKSLKRCADSFRLE